MGGNRALLAGVEVVDPPKLMYPSPGGAMNMLTDSEKISSVKNGLMALSAVDDETGLGFQGYLVPGAPGLLQLHIDEYFLSYVGSVLAYRLQSSGGEKSRSYRVTSGGTEWRRRATAGKSCSLYWLTYNLRLTSK